MSVRELKPVREHTPSAQILVIDDDADLLRLLVMRLNAWDYRVVSASSAEEGLSRIAVETPHLVLSDIRLPGKDGLALFEEIQARWPTLPVILLTAHGTIPEAVQAMTRGVFSYLTKPFDTATLHHKIKEALHLSRPMAQTVEGEAWRSGILYRSSRMAELMAEAKVVANSDASVLIRGESGTGKELLARAIHRASPRAARPFVAINCAAMPEQLLESELFGHVRGAFTGASNDHVGLFKAADGGTLFLDEIGDMPTALQVKLLRVLQERAVRPVGATHSITIDVRVLSATHRDLTRALAEGQFREDLYYRLHVIALKLPPLRERGADVVEIAQSFLTRQSERMGRDNMRFAHDAEQAIRHYPWPGNVRELENAIERSVILCEGSDISAELLGIDIELDDLEDGDFTEQSLQQGSSGNHEPTEDLSLEDYFQHFVLEHQDHMTETELARKLGISRKCLWERRQRLGIPRRKSGAATGS